MEALHLPVEIAIIVPSTKGKNKPVSSYEFEKRTKVVRTKLSNWFGGYTRISGRGGFVSGTKEIKERVNIVYSYSTRKKWSENREKLRNYLRAVKKKWGQISIGFLFEGDMYQL